MYIFSFLARFIILCSWLLCFQFKFTLMRSLNIDWYVFFVKIIQILYFIFVYLIYEWFFSFRTDDVTYIGLQKMYVSCIVSVFVIYFQWKAFVWRCVAPFLFLSFIARSYILFIACCIFRNEMSSQSTISR